MTNKKLINRWKASVQNNYGTPTIALVKGSGIVVTDADGKKYLDFLGGIATNILGHAHPSVIKAVTRQISVLSHVSNFYAHPNAEIEFDDRRQRRKGFLLPVWCRSK
jgi:acetylornithine aminotransferase